MCQSTFSYGSDERRPDRHDVDVGGLPTDRRHRGSVAQRPGWQRLVSDLRINWVWNPPWGPDKITDDGREQLRALGFTV
jgi:hypothetical protein